MVLDNCLSSEHCNQLIQKFNDSELVERDSKWEQDYKSFKELNLTTHPEFKIEQDLFYNRTSNLFQFYKEKCKVEFFPNKFGYEDVRMKRYNVNDKDQFGWHTDVGDYASARRFLVMFYYLNDVKEGGETVFKSMVDDKELFIKPEQGRIVIFPPMWMYPHKGMKPISNSKYIISTYLHYL